MRKFILILSACALILLGSSISASADAGARPFRATLAGEVTFVPSSACPAPFMSTMTVGSGTATHLGSVTMTAAHCAGFVFNGQMTLVAANGDKVFMTYDGTSTDTPVVHITGGFQITGGTGRFIHATGSGTYTATITNKGFGPGAPPWPGVWVYVGTIGY